MDLSSSTEEEEAASLQHIGSCHGKGVRNKNYHGYTQDDDGNLVRKRCACCDLECRLCKEWALQTLNNTLNQNTRPPMKAPPMDKHLVMVYLGSLAA